MTIHESVFNGEEHNIPLEAYKIKPRLMIGRTNISQYLNISGLVEATVYEYFIYDEHRTYCWCSPQEHFAMNHLGYSIKEGSEIKVDLGKMPKQVLDNKEYQEEDGFNSVYWLEDEIRDMNYDPCTDGHPDESILLWDTATGQSGEAWSKLSNLETEEFSEDYETFAEIAHTIQEDIVEYTQGSGGFDSNIGNLFSTVVD